MKQFLTELTELLKKHSAEIHAERDAFSDLYVEIVFTTGDKQVIEDIPALTEGEIEKRLEKLKAVG